MDITSYKPAIISPPPIEVMMDTTPPEVVENVIEKELESKEPSATQNQISDEVRRK